MVEEIVLVTIRKENQVLEQCCLTQTLLILRLLGRKRKGEKEVIL